MTKVYYIKSYVTIYNFTSLVSRKDVQKLLNDSNEIVVGIIKKEFSNRQASELEVR